MTRFDRDQALAGSSAELLGRFPNVGSGFVARLLTFVVASAFGLLLLADAGAASTTPHRSVSLASPRVKDAALVVSGVARARGGDVSVLYLARRCAPTLRSARRHYVIAYGRAGRRQPDRFRATIAVSEAVPRRGRACYLLVDARGRVQLRASRQYRM